MRSRRPPDRLGARFDRVRPACARYAKGGLLDRLSFQLASALAELRAEVESPHLRAGTRYRSAERNLGPERRLGCGSRLRAKPEPRNINFIYLHGRGKDVAGPAEPGQLWRRVEWGADGFLHWLAAVRLEPIAPERLADVLAIQW